MENRNSCDCGATPENRWPHHDECGSPDYEDAQLTEHNEVNA